MLVNSKDREATKTRKCKACGNEVISRYLSARFCSPQCWNLEQRKHRKTRACEICGKEFWVTRLTKRNKTCSRACGWKLERRRINKICKQCGGEFWTHHSYTARSFCSRKCGNAWNMRQIIVKCAYCKVPFNRGAAFVKRVKNTFCTKECSRKFHRGAKSPMFRGGEAHFRGTDWAKQARSARKRDNNLCGVCNTPKRKGEALSVDHIIPYRMFPCNDLVNLISLCRSCHSSKTSMIEPKIIEGDRIGFFQKLQEYRWPMDKAEAALSHFEKSPQLPLLGNSIPRKRRHRKVHVQVGGKR